MVSSSIFQIFNSARDLSDAIHITGITSSSKAFFILQLHERSDRPIVVICPDDESGAELAADIEALAATSNAPSPEILQFPTWDQHPYQSIAPSIRTRFARIATLASLSENEPHRGEKKKSRPLIICSVPSLSQATVPVDIFRHHSFRLKESEILDSKEVLFKKLRDVGYFYADPVEDPGTFTHRGEIIDIFPVHSSHAVRIELFDNLIERIRQFDPATQRTLNDKIESVFIPPAREVIINSSTTAKLRERIKQFADDNDIPRTARDPILSALQEEIYPEHSDTWAPFAYDSPATLLNYLDSGIFIWNDEAASLQAWDAFHESAKSETENSKNIIPNFSDLFRWNDTTESQVRQQTAYHLDRIHLADISITEQQEVDDYSPYPNVETKISAHHKVFVRNNEDLISKVKTQPGRTVFDELEPKLNLWRQKKFNIFIFASTQSQLDRIQFLLQQRKLQTDDLKFIRGSLSEGFRWPAESIVCLTEDEILGSKHSKTARKASRQQSGSAAQNWSGLQALSDLSVNDAVVHVEHGIGRYLGLSRLSLSGAPSDFLQIEYANRDKLYVPIYRLNVVQKYVGSADMVTLDKLGSQQFAKTKEKVKDAVQKLAVNLIELYALRKTQNAYRFSPRDTIFSEFEGKFPFQETPDQLKAIDDSLKDMESGVATDRLICGDVGYGKTEVAMRAAYRAVLDGKQVAVLVPTTILALQHEQSFRNRFEGTAVKIESISRFKSAKEQKQIIESLSHGKVDIIIGTHRLLSRDVAFHDLGLVIVDEEHRFGVDHKEKLKLIKSNVHTLTLTATPIPRTLHMSLSGLRDISLIHTPPVDRLPIRTYISKFDEDLIQRAIETELKRGGQVFFVHNRVQTIYETAKDIQELLPNMKVGVGHGQMSEKDLEEVMVSFYKKEIQVLVCTTIIESGLDIPSANTIIINRADALGLAQLYQIRGRVGRGQHRAYAYLLIPAEKEITEDAKKRLEVLQKFVELGSGFSIASHDLEIRGGGDLLGPQQSGNIAAVGFDLYTELLEEAIHELNKKGPKSTAITSIKEPEIKIPFPAYLSEDYIPDVHQRLSIYRRFSSARDDGEIISLEEELKDRYGTLPDEAQNFIWLIRIKQLLKKHRIEALTVGPEKFSLMMGLNSATEPDRIIKMISQKPSQYQLTPDSKLVINSPCSSLKEVNFTLEALLEQIRGAQQVVV